jgi:dTDP-4-dehydrorhamnose reductase
VLWERAESKSGNSSFAWSDARLQRLRELKLPPILGLVHHGSGPTHTSLVSACFPDKLAAYARTVAARYPWVEAFTPINEPLTTARFSCLYGHWYPHAEDDRSFVRALLNQCKAVAGAMAAIRTIIPAARLVQTEDMGCTRSTSLLRYQADFENERRWLSFDLLTGRVSVDHPLRSFLLRSGATIRELEAFQAHPCPPDVIGINYYVTSERFLDHRTHLYPPRLLGGNGRHAYADIEAVRICREGLVGPEAILLAAHERYGIPVAITEAHLGCDPVQQMSWLSYVWQSAAQARKRGADVRGVTAWALLGAHGWDQLVTRASNTYEPGAFDVVSGTPRETAVAHFLRALARGRVPETEPGWWTQPARLLYRPEASSRAA